MPEPQIAVKVALLGPAVAADAFGRTVSNGWGPADTGQVWTTSGGAPGDYAVTSGTGRHTVNATDSPRITLMSIPGLTDFEARFLVRFPAASTGAQQVAELLTHYASTAIHYRWEIGLQPAGNVDVRLARVVGSNRTVVATPATPAIPVGGYTPGQQIQVVCQYLAGRFCMTAYPAGGATGDAPWQIEYIDPSPLAAGQLGFFTLLAGGNTNGTAVMQYDGLSVTPYWTDLASRLLYGDGGGPLTIDVGRQTELQDVEPTRIAGTLKNGDGWLNPRNPSSPYYGQWEQGRRVRVTETVGGEDIDLATGYLEIPDVQVNSPNLDQPCSISAVDRLGRLAGAAPFDGTLAEHIRVNGGQLVEWYPLSDPGEGGQFQSMVTAAVTDRIISGFGGQTAIAAEPDELLKPGDIAGPPGDDQSYARWAPVGDAAGLSTFADAELRVPVALTAGLSDTIALSAWVQLEAYNMAPTSVEPQGWTVSLRSAQSGLTLGKDYITGSTFYNGASLYYPGGGATTYLNAGREYERFTWRLATVRFNLATGLLELFVGADVAASSTVAVPTGPMTFDELSMGLGWSGGIAHAQVRMGPAASTMTRAMHLAQYAHGYRGLQRQTVAERIATLAGYAGVPASDLELPAEASTPLQRAELGGTNPAAAMQDAATAGQDTLMTTPQGRITLIPRGRRYNQPVSLSIPFGWLSRGGIRYRPDKPVTDAVGSRKGGGSARRVDAQLRARYGVNSRSITLDAAIDADVANWVSWTLAAFGQPRTRCPVLRIDMLKRALADRKALLRLTVGDRIQLTGMPANSPEDVPHLIVQGIRHIIGPHRKRLIEYNTSPLLGPTPGVPPACPVVGDLVSNAAIVAY